MVAERKAERPILPLRFFSTVPLSNVIWSNFVASITVNIVLFNVPLYLQAVRQTSPTTSGLYLVSPLVGDSIAAVATGFYITITRNMKPPMVLGSILALGGAIAVTCLSAATPTQLVPYLIPFVPIGQGFFFPGCHDRGPGAELSRRTSCGVDYTRPHSQSWFDPRRGSEQLDSAECAAHIPA